MKLLFPSALFLALAPLAINAKPTNVFENNGQGPIVLPVRAYAQEVFDYWTPERVASARPRDYYMDERRQLRERSLQTTNEGAWTLGGDTQKAAGRILFTMGSRDYVCSGTVIEDGIDGRSIVITAGHCVYDDAAKAFASNALFIPNQDGTTGTETDFDCTNDPHGCYAAEFAVVDGQWADQSWSSNIPWDYAYYVFPDSGAHTGPGNATLDAEVPTMPTDFDYVVQDGDLITALGYSYDKDPDFRFCKLNAAVGAGSIELNGCGMSGGASGGPWILDPNDTGRGPIISVNSYGPSRGPSDYMGGPKLSGDSAACLKEVSETFLFDNVTGKGVVVDYNSGSCVPRVGGDGGGGDGGGGSGTCVADGQECMKKNCETWTGCGGLKGAPCCCCGDSVCGGGGRTGTCSPP